MPEKLVSGIVKVTTAGTRVQLPSTGSTGVASAVMVQALSTNEEPVVVGDAKVVAAVGTHATPTQSGIELAAKQTIAVDVNDASQIWVDSRKNGDGVTFLALFGY